MDRNTGNTLLLTASAGLAIGGLILNLTQIFSATKDNPILYIAFTSILLSNIFNIIRS